MLYTQFFGNRFILFLSCYKTTLVFRTRLYGLELWFGLGEFIKKYFEICSVRLTCCVLIVRLYLVYLAFSWRGMGGVVGIRDLKENPKSDLGLDLESVNKNY